MEGENEMRLIIHDGDCNFEKAIREKFQKGGKELHIVSDDGSIKQCIGCFGCWLKTPGQCVLNDHYNNMGELGGRAEDFIIISECIYGTYSPFVRNVLDRCLPYVHPYFTKRNGEIHHRPRYDNRMKVRVYFYGIVSEAEKETARKMVAANTINFNGIVEEVIFFNDKEEIIHESSIN